MRILMLIPTLTGAGAERQLAYLSEELIVRGHDVLVGSMFAGSGDWPAIVPTVRFAECGRWSPRLVRDIVRLIRSWKPDLVQTCNLRMDVAGGLASMLTGVPFVLREANSRPAYADVRSKIHSLVGRRAAAVVANSSGGAALWKRNRTFVIPNAVPSEQIRRAEPIPRGNEAVVVYVGRLEPQKNVDIVIRACSALMAERDMILYICGEGPERERLELLTQKLGTADRIRFTGFVRNAWSYQRAADVAVLLSEFEGHPNVVSECLAAGTPMVLSDIPTHRELAAGDALFVPPGDVAAAIDAIRDVLVHREAALARSQSVLRQAHAWSVAQMTDAYENVYAFAHPSA